MNQQLLSPRKVRHDDNKQELILIFDRIKYFFYNYYKVRMIYNNSNLISFSFSFKFFEEISLLRNYPMK